MAAAVFVVAMSFLSTPAYAADCETSVLTFVDCGSNGKGIWGVIDLVIVILTYIIGVLAIIGVVVAGIRYTTARDNPEGATAAKKMIFNIVIGLLIYGCIFGIMQFLLPGFGS